MNLIIHVLRSLSHAIKSICSNCIFYCIQVPRRVWRRLVSLNGVRSTCRRSVRRFDWVNLRAQRRAGGSGVLESRNDQHRRLPSSPVRLSSQPLVQGLPRDLLFFSTLFHTAHSSSSVNKHSSSASVPSSSSTASRARLALSSCAQS